jgi:hypothetical protein
MTVPSGFLPPLAPFSTEPDAIEFLTRESWSAYDLSAAMQALDGTYSMFLLARHLAVISNERNQKLAEDFERFWRHAEMGGPFFEEFFHEWRRLWRRLGPGALSYFPPFAPMGGAPQSESNARATAEELDYYLSHPSEYMPGSQELVVQKIEMASPGGFSLRGLGEPLRELRELIKDLWYRNRQERQRGELEIIQQKINLLTQGNLPTQPVQVLAVVVSGDMQELRKLIEDGKLVLPGEEPKKLEKPKTTRQRKPRRKPSSDEGGS